MCWGGQRGAEMRGGGRDDKDTLYTCKSVFKYKRYEPWIGWLSHPVDMNFTPSKNKPQINVRIKIMKLPLGSIGESF